MMWVLYEGELRFAIFMVGLLCAAVLVPWRTVAGAVLDVVAAVVRAVLRVAGVVAWCLGAPLVALALRIDRLRGA